MLPDSQRQRKWHSAWSARKPPLGKGNHKERGPTLLGHGQPCPRKENSFSGHICSSVAPPRLQMKTPETRAAPASGQEPCAEPAPEHRTAIQVDSQTPCPDLEAPRVKAWGSGFRGPPVSAGLGRAWPAQAVLTVGAVDAGVLVVAEEKATVALALVAAHGIDADLLAAAIVVLTLVHVCKRRGEGQSHRGWTRDTISFAARTEARHGVREGAVTMLSRGWPAPTRLRGWPRSQHPTWVHSSNPHGSPVSQIQALTHLIDKETEVQRGKATWPRFHRGKIQIRGLTPTSELSLILLDAPTPTPAPGRLCNLHDLPPTQSLADQMRPSITPQIYSQQRRTLQLGRVCPEH